MTMRIKALIVPCPKCKHHNIIDLDKPLYSQDHISCLDVDTGYYGEAEDIDLELECIKCKEKLVASIDIM